MPLVNAKNVSKIYTMGSETIRAADNVSLTIQEGEYVVIMGPSGSGKSTLMHLFGCLDTPTEGSLKVFNSDLERASDSELAELRGKYIGFIFQKFHLIPHLSAVENVALPLIFQEVGTKERIKRASKVLTDVGLGDRLHHSPSELSGGQQQRVAIARSLVTKPKMILADEPTGNLDTESGKNILKLLDDLHKEGKTIIVVTHDVAMKDVGTRRIEVKDGKVQNDVTISDRVNPNTVSSQ